MITHITALVIFSVLMAFGVLGLAIYLPGLGYMLLLALIFGMIDGFVHFTLANLGILAGIFLLAVIVDYSAGLLGAKYGGAQRSSILWGVLGLLVGLVLFPPLGAPFGLFVGIIVGELRSRKTGQQAVKAATAGVIGSLTGMLINVALALVFLGCFIAFALK